MQPSHACKASVCRYGHPLHALAERGASKHLPRLCKHSGGLASPSHLDCSADDVCTYGTPPPTASSPPLPLPLLTHTTTAALNAPDDDTAKEEPEVDQVAPAHLQRGVGGGAGTEG